MRNKQTLPEHFEWLYAYISKDSGEVGYIGRSKNYKRCALRYCEHKNDSWYSSEEWSWAFWPCLNRYESETLETIFINRYNPKWNKDKKGWGLPLDYYLGEYNGVSLEMLNRVDNGQLDTDLVVYMLYDYEQKLKQEMIKSGDWEEAKS